MPILIHGGRGLPPIADDLARLVEREPGRAADHRARRHRRPGALCAELRRQGRASSSTRRSGARRPAGLLPPDLARAGRLRVGLPLRAAAELAADRAPHRALRRLRRRGGARHARRQRRRASPTASRRSSRRTPRGGTTFTQPMELARIHQYLSMATPLLWMRQPDTIGVLGLALNACGERNGVPGGERRSRSCSRRRGDLWQTLPEPRRGEQRCRRSARRSGCSTWPTSWR